MTMMTLHWSSIIIVGAFSVNTNTWFRVLSQVLFESNGHSRGSRPEINSYQCKTRCCSHLNPGHISTLYVKYPGTFNHDNCQNVPAFGNI